MKRNLWMAIVAGVCVLSSLVVAQDVESVPPMQPMPTVTDPGPVTMSKIAIFVKNQTKVPGMDDAVDGVRDRLSAELSAAGLIVLDQADLVSSFNRYKVTTAEERAGLIDGVFTGGSTVRMAQMMGVDYVMVASIISADRAVMSVGGSKMVAFTLRMSVRVNEAVQGASVYGKTWTRKIPATADNVSETDASVYYNDLIDLWASETGVDIAEKSRTWKKVDVASIQLVSFSVSTMIDDLIQGLESGVRAPNELLNEMRHIIGGATVEIDGAVVGSSPGTYRIAPGLHQMRIWRQWMKDWQGTVSIQEGSRFNVGMELSDEGFARYQTMEKLKAQIAIDYAEAMLLKGVSINFDTSAWRDVGVGNHMIRQNGVVNQIDP